MKRSSLFIALALVLLIAPAMGQAWDPEVGYPNYNWVDQQTRSIPAGTVMDPGSHLTWIVDTGVNARAIYGAAIPLSAVTNNVQTDLGSQLADRYQSYISITNTHPTMAVTVHFRYYNDNCDDLLDFLVVLTCNDTLLFDPLNFEIPETGGLNTRARLLGPAQGPLTPITTRSWGSGRFVITAAASGTSTDVVDDAEILFPYEMRAHSGKCNIFYRDTATFPNPTLAETLAGFSAGSSNDTRFANVGIAPSLNAQNLHVFNASQISFNYLIGFYTTAKPLPQGMGQASWGHNAWARPAIQRLSGAGSIDLGWDDDNSDGDSMHAPTGILVLGSEAGSTSDATKGLARLIPANGYYLRSDVHGGDINDTALGGFSLYGALGTQGFYAGYDQAIHLLSVYDDYNGNNNAGQSETLTFQDNSANIGPAFTTYVLQIYDNDEHLLRFIGETPINVSPPQETAVANLKAVCFCLRTFLTSTISAETNVDDISMADLDSRFGGVNITSWNASGPISGWTTPTTGYKGLLAANAAPKEAGGGWIRFVRDNTNIVTISEAVNLAISGPFVGTASGPGTATPNSAALVDDTEGPSFLVLGDHVLRFEGFGVAQFLHAVAQDPAASGTPNVPNTME
jgi:hypothetical protein